MDDLKMVAWEILHQHSQSTEDLHYLGAGEQSICYGTTSFVILLAHGQVAQESNDYKLQRWLTISAAGARVRTPQILAVGDHPRPYALMQRARGIKAADHPRASEEAAAWFHRMGEEVRKINHIHTKGFGAFLPCGPERYCGRYATWPDYLDAQSEHYLFPCPVSHAGRRIQELFLAQGILSHAEFEKIEAQVQAAKSWPVQSVLTHYDNRLDNLMIDGEKIILLDWGLAFAGIGIQQEMIKLFESEPLSLDNPRVAAFLQGYGLTGKACTDAIEGGKLMLILDGLAMSSAWAAEPDRVAGIRAWLHTIKKICDEW